MCQTVKAFLPDMISRDRGHIVSMSSGGGLFGVSGLADYGASKAAVVGFHEAVRMELYALNKPGVHMTLVCPFFINTGMFDGTRTRFLMSDLNVKFSRTRYRVLGLELIPAYSQSAHR